MIVGKRKIETNTAVQERVTTAVGKDLNSTVFYRGKKHVEKKSVHVKFTPHDSEKRYIANSHQLTLVNLTYGRSLRQLPNLNQLKTRLT